MQQRFWREISWRKLTWNMIIFSIGFVQKQIPKKDRWWTCFFFLRFWVSRYVIIQKPGHEQMMLQEAETCSIWWIPGICLMLTKLTSFFDVKWGFWQNLYITPQQANKVHQTNTRWWFQTFFKFTPIWGRFPFWLIFFRWVETTNQK